MKKTYGFIDGRWREVKGKDFEKLNSYLTEDYMTLSEIKEQYPDKYETLMNWIKTHK